MGRKRTLAQANAPAPAGPPVPSSTRFNAAEICDFIKYEFDAMNAQNMSTRNDLERSLIDREELDNSAKNFYETAYFLNVQLHKQVIVNDRLRNIVEAVLRAYPDKELQDQFDIVDDVGPKDVERRIQNNTVAYQPFPIELYMDDGRSYEIGPYGLADIDFSDVKAAAAVTKLPEDLLRKFGSETGVPAPGTTSSASGYTSSSTVPTMSSLQAKDDEDKEMAAQEAAATVALLPSPRGGDATEASSSSAGTAVVGGGRPVASAIRVSSEPAVAADNTAFSVEPGSTSTTAVQNGSAVVGSSESSSTGASATSTGASGVSGGSVRDTSNSIEEPLYRSTNFKLHFSWESFHPVSAMTIDTARDRLYAGHRGVFDVFALSSCRHLRTEYDVFDKYHMRASVLSRDSNQLYFCGESYNVIGWDIEQRRRCFCIRSAVHQYALTFMDANTLLCSVSAGVIGAYDIRAPHLAVTAPARGDGAASPASIDKVDSVSSPTGNVVDKPMGMFPLPRADSGRISSMHVAEDGCTLYASDAAGYVRSWDLRKLASPSEIQLPGGEYRVRSSTDPSMLAEHYLNTAVNSVSLRSGVMLAGKANGWLDQLDPATLDVIGSRQMRTPILAIRHLRPIAGEAQTPCVVCGQDGGVTVWGGGQRIKVEDAVLCVDTTDRYVACGLWNHHFAVFKDHSVQ